MAHDLPIKIANARRAEEEIMRKIDFLPCEYYVRTFLNNVLSYKRKSEDLASLERYHQRMTNALITTSLDHRSPNYQSEVSIRGYDINTNLQKFIPDEGLENPFALHYLREKCFNAASYNYTIPTSSANFKVGFDRLNHVTVSALNKTD